jgi:hypothetical protein
MTFLLQALGPTLFVSVLIGFSHVRWNVTGPQVAALTVAYAVCAAWAAWYGDQYAQVFPQFYIGADRDPLVFVMNGAVLSTAAALFGYAMGGLVGLLGGKR